MDILFRDLRKGCLIHKNCPSYGECAKTILRSLVARIFMQQTRGERFVDCLVVRLCCCCCFSGTILSAYTSRLLPPASIYTSTTAVRGTVRWLIHLCLCPSFAVGSVRLRWSSAVLSLRVRSCLLRLVVRRLLIGGTDCCTRHHRLRTRCSLAPYSASVK